MTISVVNCKKKQVCGCGKKDGGVENMLGISQQLTNEFVLATSKLRTASPRVCCSQNFAGTAGLHYGSCRFLLAFFSCFVLAADSHSELLPGIEVQRT